MAYINIPWSKMGKRHKRLSLTIIILALVGAGFWIWSFNRGPSVKSYEFVGVIKNMDGQSLTLKGQFIDNGNSVSKDTEVVVVVTADTKITKSSIHLPTAEEVRKTDGRYDPSKLKREMVAGSLSDLKNFDSTVDIKSSSDIYNKSRFEASEIIYTIPVYPN